MSIKDQLEATPPVEVGGSVSSRGLDFQKDWSLCKLLELHLSGEDYLLIFEYHDDLLELDSASNPTNISFYQIKTSTTKTWTLKRLLNRDKKGDSVKLSYLGKMYANKVHFPNSTKSLNFISDAPFTLKANGEPKASAHADIVIKDCDPKEIEKISKQLQAEHSLKDIPTFAEITFLRNAGLNVKDSDTHALGKLTKFLGTIEPKKLHKSDLVYKVLIDEIKRKSALIPKAGITFDEIAKQKGISRVSFQEILQGIGFSSDFDALWSSASQAMLLAGEDPREVEKIRKNWREFEIKLMDKADEVHGVLCDVVDVELAEALKTEFGEKLPTLLNTVVSRYKKTSFYAENPLYSDQYVKAVALRAYYDER